jgi:hypothetical protein
VVLDLAVAEVPVDIEQMFLAQLLVVEVVQKAHFQFLKVLIR